MSDQDFDLSEGPGQDDPARPAGTEVDELGVDADETVDSTRPADDGPSAHEDLEQSVAADNVEGPESSAADNVEGAGSSSNGAADAESSADSAEDRDSSVIDLSEEPVETGRPERTRTDDGAVDDALDRLDAVDGSRMQDQIDELTATHRTLQGRLSDLHD